MWEIAIYTPPSLEQNPLISAVQIHQHSLAVRDTDSSDAESPAQAPAPGVRGVSVGPNLFQVRLLHLVATSLTVLLLTGN